MKETTFFRDKPLFALDIRPDSVRVMQTSHKSGSFVIKGYGMGVLDPTAIKDGLVAKPELVAQSTKLLLDNTVQGHISTKRVAIALPASRIFSRAIKLPLLTPKELTDAVMLEIEQYTPVPINSLYVDYTPILRTDTEIEVFAVAAPKQVVDSYLQVADILNLEPVLVETRVDSIRRLFVVTKYGNIPSVLIDFDKTSVDISIVDRNIIATGTVNISANFAQQVVEQIRLGAGRPIIASPSAMPDDSKKDNQVQLFNKEIRRMVRYYEERYDKTRRIEQIVLLGNDTMLPNIVELMTDQLRLPVRSSDLWQLFSYDNGVSPIPVANSFEYIAVAGLSVAPAKQVFL